MIQTLPINDRGIDYVVGDIHGCFALLAEGLNRIRFDPERDRLFALGDLIDRGPESELVLEWLAHEWFFSVRGNHEQMILNSCRSNSHMKQVVKNGGEWWGALSEEQREPFKACFDDLPLVIEVATSRGMIGLVHANVPDFHSWQEFKEMLPKPFYVEHALWKRDRAKGKIVSKILGVERVFFGHSVFETMRPVAIANTIFMDTGACYADEVSGLSIMPLMGELDDAVCVPALKGK